MSFYNSKSFAKYIDHTALKAVTTVNDIKILCEEADKYKFASVCVNPYYVNLAKKLLVNSSVKVCTVIGFPLGANLTEIKACEAKKAVEDGADEVDMVLNISAIKSGEYDYVKEDVNGVVNSVSKSTCVKVIIETCYLTKDEIKIACELSKSAGANFVKTSTGFGTSGADSFDVKLMKDTVGDSVEVKASGGIKDYYTAETMIENGATRLGTSSGLDILSGKKVNITSEY
jgi:deoxyribose-phosphate aldolase